MDYAITAHTAVFANLLSRQQVPFEVLGEACAVQCEQEIMAGDATAEAACEVLDLRVLRANLPAGSLRVPITQHTGRLLPLLLDPRSQSSVFRYPSYARLIERDAPLCVARVTDA